MAGRITGWAEPLYLVAIAPLLLFPTFRPEWTAAALAGLGLLWLLRAIVRREPWPVTPFNPALLVLCLAIPLAVWASPVPDLTLPKLTGIILGVAAFRAIAFSARSRRGLVLALAALAAAGLAIWGIGLLGMRLPPLQPLTQRLPAALVSLPGAEQGINPNQLAGALLLLLPLALAGAVAFWRNERRGLAALLALTAMLALATLALTRSRAGWIGFAAALGFLVLALVWLSAEQRTRKVFTLALGVALIVAVLATALALPSILASGRASDAAVTTGDAVLQQLSLDARVEIWSRAVYALQDFPFTGVGLGAFRRVVNVLYPLFLVPPDADIAHSHNMFLQVGVDLGLFGLIGYVGLLVVAAVSAWQVAVARRGCEGIVALGALAALIGFHVYGLADALALGSKPSLVFWVTLGLLAALSAPVEAEDQAISRRAADAAPAATPG